MKDPTVSEVSQMVQVIIDLHDNTGMFFNESGYNPLPNSQAALELQTYKRPESLHTAYSQGTVLIEVVADQVMAITKTLIQPVQTISRHGLALVQL